MSEEVRNAPIVIPRILVQTIAINGGLAFVFVLVLLFCIGDIEKAMNTPTGYPIIQIFYQATGSVKAATAMMSSITIIGMASSTGVVASVSRLTWAFARDGGLPFSKFFAHVRRDSFSTQDWLSWLSDSGRSQASRSLPCNRPRLNNCSPAIPY